MEGNERSRASAMEGGSIGLTPPQTMSLSSSVFGLFGSTDLVKKKKEKKKQKKRDCLAMGPLAISLMMVTLTAITFKL
ncbi:hypothetical protein V2J09_008490 [Rumex salicifolius]